MMRPCGSISSVTGSEYTLSWRIITVLLSSLALFVRYQLTVTAPLPEADKAAQAVGRERFRRFVDQVGRQLATGRSIGARASDNGAVQ